MSALRILILSDGRPGHLNLAEGIALAVGRRRETAVDRLEVRRTGWPGWAMAAATRARLSPALILRRLYGLDSARVPPSDLLVSAGAVTLAANIALARLGNIPNIFYGSLRAFSAHDFALVLTSYLGRAARPNHAMALKPAPFDPAVLPELKPLPGRLPRIAGLLLGGSTSRGIAYDPADWDRLIAAMNACRRGAGTGFIVSNSRRTEATTSDRFASLAREPEGPLLRFVDVRQPEAAKPVEIFAEAEAVLVTADSSSMLSEAVWARRPAIALAPEHCRLETNEASYRRHLETKGWCRTLAIAELTPDRLAAALAEIAPMSVNPLDALADLIARRLPQVAS
jgi:hypothetical protein